MSRVCTHGVVMVFILLSVVALSQAKASVINFETAVGNDNDDFVATNPMFGGLNWSQNGDQPNKSRWQIDTDNNPFASLPTACLDDATKWVQGFAEGVSTPSGGPGDPNRAKFGWDGTNPFTFSSIWLKTRFVSDAPNSPDANNDGIDDRWLTSIELVFRDTLDNESNKIIDLTDPIDPSGWIEVTAADVTGSADLSDLKAVFFYGDSGTTVAGVRNDRFAIDNLDVVTSQNGSPPVAKCQDVTASADDNCQGNIDPENVDNGSCDPDGHAISLSLEPTGPYELGDTPVTLTVTDEDGDFDTCEATVTVVDDVAPTVQAELVQVAYAGNEDDEDDGSLYRVVFSATDNCDDSLKVKAFIKVCGRRIPVDNGQLVEIENDDDDCEIERDNGKLELEARKVVLKVRARDDSGNVGKDKAVIVTPRYQGDDDDD